MKPEYKIVAAVVVLSASAVVVTAAVVAMKLPRWRQKAKEQHQESVLQGMTPDKAIALCGPSRLGRDPGQPAHGHEALGHQE